MKKDEKKDDRANLKVPCALHRQIKIAAAQRGEEMYRLVEEAWENRNLSAIATERHYILLRELSLQTGKNVPQLIDEALERTYDKNRMPTSQSIPPAHLEAHALLDQILMSGDQKAIEWIHGNLKMFAEALEARVELPPAKRAKPGEQD